MKILFFVLVIIFSYLIMVKKGSKKLSWFFAGILFFPPTIVLLNSPAISFPRSLIYVLFIYTIVFENKRIKRDFKYFPLRFELTFLFLMLLIIGMSDERVSMFLKLYRPSTYFIENFLVIFLSYYHIRRIEDITKVYRSIILFLFFFSLYGISNFLTGFNEYSSLIAEAFGKIDLGNAYINDQRFRVSSFSWHPIFYGFLVSVGLLIVTFWLNTFKLNKHNKFLFSLIVLLLFVNLLLVNSRTPILSLSIGLIIYFIGGLSLKNKLVTIARIFAISILIIALFPNTIKIINATFESLTTKETKVGGSSIDMRQGQFEASLIEFLKSPIVGNGFYYIIEGLGYSSSEEERSSGEDFYGFESYSYELMIEQGICGIIGNLIFLAGLFLFFLKKSRDTLAPVSKMAVLSLAMLMAFLLFIFGTGDMGSFPFFMSIMGINMKAVLLFKNSLNA